MKTINTTPCYHCGTNCEEETHTKDLHQFCCIGCVSVYSILQENGLCNYYDLENNPGIRLKAKAKSEFAYLENSEIIESVIEFKNDDYIQVNFYIPQIHCYSCVWLLEKLYQLRDGVSKSTVNYLKKEVTLGFNQKEITLREVVELLASIGYEPLINLDQKKRTQQQPLRQLYIQLGVTGFCFGNIMLLSFPEYIANIQKVELEYAYYFGFISLLLSLPIVFYGAADYFKSSLGAVKNKRVNLDIPISIGIIALFVFSSIEVIFSTGSGYFDSLAGLVFFLLSGKLFQQKTFDQLNFERDYKSYFPLAVTKLVNSEEVPLPASQIQEGDRLLIRNNEIISSDSILFSSNASIDYSFVSGESVPVEKVAGEKLYAGGRLLGCSIEVEVLKQTSQSYLTRLWNQYENKSGDKLRSLSDTISKYFIIAVLFIAIGAGLFWINQSVAIALKAFTSVLIVACPCALALAIPFTYGNAIRLLGHLHFYVKNTSVLEALDEVKHVVFDKTGTLTSLNDATINYEGMLLSSIENQWIKSVIKHSNHPLSRVIFNYLKESTCAITNFQEIPGKGVQATIDNITIKIGSSNFVSNAVSNSSETAVHVAINDEYKGKFIIGNVYLKGTSSMFSQLTNSYNVAVLSGDNAQEKTTLETLIQSQATIRFHQTPFDKQDYILEKEKEGIPTLMVGDGLNDSGALKAATVGIAVTQHASNFSPSSDIIVDATKVTQLPQVLKFAKASKKIVYWSFGISFGYNLTGLFFAVQGQLSPLISAILMPVSSVTVMVFAIVATNYMFKKIMQK